nr:MAG TPA: hypothetical protein [Caudoviricetes sp.]
MTIKIFNGAYSALFYLFKKYIKRRNYILWLVFLIH